jgi:hypothetical protein
VGAFHTAAVYHRAAALFEQPDEASTAATMTAIAFESSAIPNGVSILAVCLYTYPCGVEIKVTAVDFATGAVQYNSGCVVLSVITVAALWDTWSWKKTALCTVLLHMWVAAGRSIWPRRCSGSPV